jgi:hypothetical protein
VIAALSFRGPNWDDTLPTIAQEPFPGHLEWVDEHRDGPSATVVEVAPFHDPKLRSTTS